MVIKVITLCATPFPTRMHNTPKEKESLNNGKVPKAKERKKYRLL
jgi:hypothetical protein